MPLVSSRTLRPLLTQPGRWAIPAHVVAGRRVGGYKYISIQQTPSTPTTVIDVKTSSISASTPDATFEVLGTPYSVLSVTLSPSQPLHTRRGTLVGLNGDPSTVVSTLRTLNPIRRALVGIPFLYQRVTSTTPVSLLIAPKSTSETLAIIQLDGSQDWNFSQRAALLAWTGSNLAVKPTISSQFSVAHWGTSSATGRGLVALAAKGHIFALELAKGESYVAHPSNILAYTTTSSPIPQPFRFRSSQARFQIPLQLGNWFPDSRFVRAWKTSNTYKFLQSISLRVKTWSRRTIWGDRLFLRFEGPTTLLIQSRGNRVTDILTREQVNEIADAPAGSVAQTVRNIRIQQEDPYIKKTIAQEGYQAGQDDTPTATQATHVEDRLKSAGSSTGPSPGAKELERLGRDGSKTAASSKVEGTARTDHAG